MPDLGPAERFINDMLSVERDFIKDALRLYRILRLDLVDLISAIGLGADLEGRIRQRLEQFRQAIQNLVLEYLQRLEAAGDRMAQRSLSILREVESRIPDFTALQFTTAADRQNALGQLVLHIADFVGVLESRFNSTIAELRQGGENETAALRRLTATSLVDGQASVYRHGANELRTEAQRNLWATGAALLALYYAEVQRRGVRLQKQAVATIDKRTTKTCLRVHGQIKNVGQPFELTAKPRFARKQQHPPFHWNCRTVEAPYLPVLEEMGLTTGQMRDRARAELRTRV